MDYSVLLPLLSQCFTVIYPESLVQDFGHPPYQRSINETFAVQIISTKIICTTVVSSCSNHTLFYSQTVFNVAKVQTTACFKSSQGGRDLEMDFEDVGILGLQINIERIDVSSEKSIISSLS